MRTTPPSSPFLNPVSSPFPEIIQRETGVMKRYPYNRDGPSSFKRHREDNGYYNNNRGPYDYDDDRFRGGDRRMRGGGGRGRGPPGDRGGGRGGQGANHTYIPRSDNETEFCYELAGYNLAVGVDDDTVSNTLFSKFAQFGKCKLGLEGEGKDRLAVISFKGVEDAKEARRCLQGMVVFDRKLFIKPYHVFREEQQLFGDSETRAFHKYNRETEGNNNTSRTSSAGRSDRQRQYSGEGPLEDDPRATRTLFVGNVENDYPESRLRALFERFGRVSNVEMKRNKDSHTCYAFVKFTDVQEAMRAKDELDGYSIGNNMLKIGYGKGVTSNRIWIGGLGSWTQKSELENEFDRFGKITKLDYKEGDYQGYVMYESQDAATAALNEMKGYPLGGPSHRITVDYADPSSPAHPSSEPRSNGSSIKSSPKKRSSSKQHKSVCKTESLEELCNRYPMAWKGSIILKTNAFSVKLFLVGGDPAVAEKLLVKSTIGSSIRITQRLKLEKQKLDQLNTKLQSAGAGGHCILVGMTTPGGPDLPDDVQHRPLRHLLQYFIQKQAAGISTIDADGNTGVLHTFAPCDFAQGKLLKAAPNLESEPSKEDYLILILVKEDSE
eukprot:sb/3463140/